MFDYILLNLRNKKIKNNDNMDFNFNEFNNMKVNGIGIGFEDKKEDILKNKSQLLVDLKGEPGKDCGGFCNSATLKKLIIVILFPLDVETAHST